MISAMHRSRLRLAPLALAAALALGACGGGDESATDTVPAADSADGTDSADDGLMAPRPVRSAGGGSAASSATAEAAPAATGDKMASDMMMPYRIITFVASEGLELPSNDIGYAFEAGATVSAEQVAALAAALGVPGEPERTDDGFSAYWRVGPDDGTAPSLWVYEDAQLSWNYSSAWATGAVAESGCAFAEPGVSSGSEGSGGDAPVSDVAVPPTDVAMAECVEPEPPANVPSQADAEAKASDIMTAVGLDPAGFRFETYADEWFASTSAVEQLDGAFGGRNFSAGFGGDGVLQYASGQLAEPVKVGPYPLIDLDTAIARLNDPSGFYGGFPRLGVDVIASAESVGASEPVLAVEPAVGSAGDASMPVESMPPESMPPVSMPEPEAVTVTLVAVEADVWWAYDVDGSVWLLPAYRFIGDDGGWYTVPAVTDEFLVQVPADELPMPEPMPEPMPVETKPGDVPTESFPEDAMELFDTAVLEGLVGSSLAEFTAEAEALGASVRVTEIDGVPQPVTMDYSTTRVNVAVTGEGDTATVTAILDVG